MKPKAIRRQEITVEITTALEPLLAKFERAAANTRMLAELVDIVMAQHREWKSVGSLQESVKPAREPKSKLDLIGRGRAKS
jgi:hypothetical protein